MREQIRLGGVRSSQHRPYIMLGILSFVLLSLASLLISSYIARPVHRPDPARMSSSSKLFQPLRVGNVELSNRIVMAPLSRFRADAAHVPLPFVAEYYAQRASYPGTLLVAEATFIAPQAGGYAHVPGIYNAAQIDAWKKVTAAVHAKKSFIFLQLWALGRTADYGTLREELGPSARVVGPSGGGFPGGPAPTALTDAEIWEYVGLYKQAATNAIAAGFDGVEIHGANGFLVDQFLQRASNTRTDAWGGSVANRARFPIEVAKAVAAAVGPERTAIRVSPSSGFQGMGSPDADDQFAHLARELKKLNLAYFHAIVSRTIAAADPPVTDVDHLVDIWGDTSPFFLAGGFSPATARATAARAWRNGSRVAVVFGRHFISNPDLVFRVREGVRLTPYDRSTFYTPAERRGYTTWGFSEEWLAAQAGEEKEKEKA